MSLPLQPPLAPMEALLVDEIPVGQGWHGRFSFDDLLQRIHPAASRVQKLARQSPAIFIAFDLLVLVRGRPDKAPDQCRMDQVIRQTKGSLALL